MLKALAVTAFPWAGIVTVLVPLVFEDGFPGVVFALGADMEHVRLQGVRLQQLEANVLGRRHVVLRRQTKILRQSKSGLQRSLPAHSTLCHQMTKHVPSCAVNIQISICQCNMACHGRHERTDWKADMEQCTDIASV